MNSSFGQFQLPPLNQNFVNQMTPVNPVSQYNTNLGSQIPTMNPIQQQPSAFSQWANDMYTGFTNLFGSNQSQPQQPNFAQLVQDGKIGSKDALELAQADYYSKLAGDLGTSWNDIANIGLGGVNTLMQMSLFPAQKDYMNTSVDALKSQMANAQEAHDMKMKNTESYGSAFSRG
jgi:hypothetical protein